MCFLYGEPEAYHLEQGDKLLGEHIDAISPCRGVGRQWARITFKRFLPSPSKPGSDLPSSLKFPVS